MLCLTNGMCIKATASLCMTVGKNLNPGVRLPLHLIMSQVPHP